MQAIYGKQTKYCTDGCGYKIELPKQSHSSETILTINGWNNAHRTNCSVCNNYIKEEPCVNSNGQKLGCATGIAGKCVICGAERTIAHMQLSEVKCRVCGKEFYKYELAKEVLNQTQIKVKYKYIPILEGLEFSHIAKPEASGTNNTSVTDYKFTKNNDGSIEIEAILNITQNTPASKVNMRGWFNYTYEGNSKSGYDTISVYPDNYAPIVQSITATGADSTTEFSRSATITAKFEETWDSIVEMALYDSDGTVISNWSTASKDGTTFTKTFNVVAETATSKKLIVKAKDRCGNIGEGKVTIGKIDTKAPTLVSPTAYNTDWSILKQIKIEATDEGSGNVQIALGSEEDYQLGQLDNNKYYREYKLTGDVYEDIVRIVYLKDAVGNITTKRITIGKLDKTSPTITNITKNEKTITIEANDINTKLNKEGSGIKGYAISKTKEVPADNGFQTSNKFIVEETGIYYIWVKDNAGNLSQTKQIEMN